MHRFLSLFILSLLLNLTHVNAGGGLNRILKETDCDTACSLYDARRTKLNKKRITVQNTETQALFDAELSTLETYLRKKFRENIAGEGLAKAEATCVDASNKRKERERKKIIKEIFLDPKVEGYAVFPNL